MHCIHNYGKGQYFKAIPLFEELLPVYRGTDKRAEIYFYYAKSQYEMDNAIMAGFHFKRLYDQHSLSEFAEESLFMHAESYYAQSPKWSLDQTPTYEALQAYQNFINILVSDLLQWDKGPKIHSKKIGLFPSGHN